MSKFCAQCGARLDNGPGACPACGFGGTDVATSDTVLPNRSRGDQGYSGAGYTVSGQAGPYFGHSTGDQQPFPGEAYETDDDVQWPIYEEPRRGLSGGVVAAIVAGFLAVAAGITAALWFATSSRHSADPSPAVVTVTATSSRAGSAAAASPSSNSPAPTSQAPTLSTSAFNGPPLESAAASWSGTSQWGVQDYSNGYQFTIQLNLTRPQPLVAGLPNPMDGRLRLGATCGYVPGRDAVVTGYYTVNGGSGAPEPVKASLDVQINSSAGLTGAPKIETYYADEGARCKSDLSKPFIAVWPQTVADGAAGAPQVFYIILPGYYSTSVDGATGVLSQISLAPTGSYDYHVGSTTYHFSADPGALYLDGRTA